MYGDNCSVVHNTSRPESVLKENSNSSCFYTVCDLVEIGKSSLVYVHSSENLSNAMM